MFNVIKSLLIACGIMLAIVLVMYLSVIIVPLGIFLLIFFIAYAIMEEEGNKTKKKP
jgi:hypothetical protein